MGELDTGVVRCFFGLGDGGKVWRIILKRGNILVCPVGEEIVQCAVEIEIL